MRTLLVTGSGGRVARTLLPDLLPFFEKRVLCATPAQSNAARRAMPDLGVTHALVLHRYPDPVSPRDETELANEYMQWAYLCREYGAQRVVLASSEHALLTPGSLYGGQKLQIERNAANLSTPACLVFTDRIGRVYDPALGHDPEPDNPVPCTPPEQLQARFRGLLGLPDHPALAG